MVPDRTRAAGSSAVGSARFPPAPPTNLTAIAAKGKRKVELRWRQSTSPGVTQNRIFWSTASGGYTLRATVSATTSYADTSANSGVTYQGGAAGGGEQDFDPARLRDEPSL